MLQLEILFMRVMNVVCLMENFLQVSRCLTCFCRTQLDSARRKVEGLLSFGLKWRDKSKVNIYMANSPCFTPRYCENINLFL